MQIKNPPKKKNSIRTNWGELPTPERKVEYGRRLNRHSSNLHKKINTAISQFERHDLYAAHHSSKREVAYNEASSVSAAYRENMEYIAAVHMEELNIPEGCDAVPTKLLSYLIHQRNQSPWHLSPNHRRNLSYRKRRRVKTKHQLAGVITTVVRESTSFGVYGLLVYVVVTEWGRGDSAHAHNLSFYHFTYYPTSIQFNVVLALCSIILEDQLVVLTYNV